MTDREVELLRKVESLTRERDSLLAQLHDKESARLSGADKLASDAYMIQSFQTDLNAEDHQARLVFYAQPNQRHVLAYIIMSTPELYDFAQGILRDYDKLEGVE